MSKKRPPFVSMYRDRHRKPRWRFRKSGLPETQTSFSFDTPEWWGWYFAALKAERAPIADRRAGAGTFSALIAAYYEAADWKLLRKATQRAYRGEIERFRAVSGDKRVRDLEPRHIARMMDLKAGTPAAANNLLRVLRVLMKFAEERGWREDNPAAKVKKLVYRSEGFKTWSEAEIAAFEKRWALGTLQRLAFDLLLYTGQRSGDVRIMTAGQIVDGYVRLRQEKTAELLEVPVHPALAASLAAARSSHLVLLTTQYGEPFTEKGFSQWVVKAAKAAGLVDCSAHGLRKSAARRLAEAGCTTHQIMAITGHRSLKEVERYTRAADQRRNADAALARLAGTEAERKNV